MESGFYTQQCVFLFTYVNVLLGACSGSDTEKRVNMAQATFVFPLWSEAFQATAEHHLAEGLSCSLRTHLVCGVCLCPNHL